ncbi:MAG: DUF697 domain-containing protein [Candidatus Electrothrix sp. AS4_5]|nr:DUF697 domain-containing protein [Candidatus Electrothrix gigas]
MKEQQSKPQSKEVQAEKIIKKYTAGGAGIGLFPLPLVDLVGITALQVKLVHALALLYEIEFSEQRVKALIAGHIGGGGTVIISPRLAGTLKLLPVTAPFSLFATSALGAMTTYAVGKVFFLHFETGGTLLDFDPHALREYYMKYLSKAESTGAFDMKRSYVGVKP